MLINCVAYRGGEKLAEPPVAEIDRFVGQPDTFVWVALKDPVLAELEELQAEFGLHDLAVEDARMGHQRPKLEEYGDQMFAVMHLLELDREGELHRGEVDVFVGRDFVLSVRSGSHADFLGVRRRCEAEPELLKQGSGFVLYALLDAVVDRYLPIMERLEDELEEIEEQIFAGDGASRPAGAARETIRRLYALKRKTAMLKHAVSPLMEAVGRLYGGRVPRPCMGLSEYYRDVYDHLTRLNAWIDTMRETITTAIQVNFSMVAIEESEVNKRLAAWAGIFAVATAFAGIWGMNFEVMPELKWQWGYPVALLLMAGVCGLLYWRFRKSGWL